MPPTQAGALLIWDPVRRRYKPSEYTLDDLLAGAGGGSGGGGTTYGGAWESKTYPAGSLVVYNNRLWGANVETSARPTSPVGTDYAQNFVELPFDIEGRWSYTKNRSNGGDASELTLSVVGDQVTPDPFVTNALRTFGISTVGGGTINVMLDLFFEEAGTIEFWERSSMEGGNWDKRLFYVDGVEKHSITGIQNWVHRSYPVDAGQRQFKWTHTGDGGGTINEDAAYLAGLVTTGSSFTSAGPYEWDMLAVVPTS